MVLGLTGGIVAHQTVLKGHQIVLLGRKLGMHRIAELQLTQGRF